MHRDNEITESFTSISWLLTSNFPDPYGFSPAFQYLREHLRKKKTVFIRKSVLGLVIGSKFPKSPWSMQHNLITRTSQLLSHGKESHLDLGCSRFQSVINNCHVPVQQIRTFTQEDQHASPTASPFLKKSECSNAQHKCKLEGPAHRL